jgi:hypothetical protein
MDEDGYILLTNVLTDHDIQVGLSCIQEDRVDYSRLKQFIDQIFLKRIQENVHEISEPSYVKFRLSNNNNSTDASTFHGDIYNHTNTEILPIYTCLCYFDDAQLEIIPGSHKYNNSDWSISTYNKKKVINVNRGDILVFHANMHHRGVNYNKSENRRLLQVFEVFPDQITYDEYSSKLFIVQTSNNVVIKNIVNPLMYQLSKFPSVIDTITWFHYILMYNDLHYKVGMMDIEPWNKQGNYITYEPGRRVYMEDLKHEEINVNVMCDNNIQTIQPNRFYFYFYILYWIVSILVIYVIVKLWNGKKPTKRVRPRRK